NETAAESVRCTVQLAAPPALPTGCTFQSSGLGSHGAFLVDNTSSYAKGQTKKFDFKLTTTCAPTLVKGLTFNLTLTVCAYGGFIDPANPCSDIDITPDPSPNTVTKTVKLHQ